MIQIVASNDACGISILDSRPLAWSDYTLVYTWLVLRVKVEREDPAHLKGESDISVTYSRGHSGISECDQDN